MTRIKIPLLFLITLFLLFFPIEGQAQSQPNLINIYINETLEFSPTPVYLTATALYSDGSTRDVTFSGTWTTSNPSIASVYRGKVEFGSNTGNVTIEFTFGNLKVAVGTEVVDITDIQITNRNIKYSNTPVQIKVQGRYNHGQLSEVNEHLTWYSVNENVARVDNKGVVTFTGRPGKAFIGVLFTSPLTRQTLQDEITIIVTDDEVRKDEPAPSKPFTIKIDGQLDPSKATNTLKVYRLYADNTRDNLRNDEVSWSSSNPNIATVDNTGRVAFTGRPGSVTIYARYNNRQDSIEAFVPHKTVSLSINETLNFNQGFIATPPRLTVTGKDNSGQTQLLYNVEWSSSNPTVATIDSRGQITFTGRPGTVTFTAQRDNLSDSISTTVSNEQAKNLKTLKIIDNLFYSNSPQNLKALAYYTDGTSTEITKEAQWLSSNENVATVYNGTVYFTGASGQVRITASFEGFSDTVETIVRTPSSKRDLSIIKFQRNQLSY